MDLIPKPDQIVAASANVAHKLLYGGVADLRPMPRTLIDEGTLREVYHYRPLAHVEPTGDPVLLVTPLAAPSLCYDLRRGCSLVEHLVTAGRPTYLVEYGEVSFRDRSLGMEHWVQEVVPEAIRQVSAHAGGRPVHVVGWSLGGIFTLLTAAAWSSLPIATVTTVGSPVDVRQVPLIAPVRPFLGVGGDRAAPIALAYRMMGGIPKPVVRRAFQLSAFNKLVTKPFVQLAKLDDADFLAQLEAVDRFTANMIAYPGRTFGQLYHRMVRHNELAEGTVHFEGRDISFADITVPVLAFGGANDAIAPVSCVRPVRDLLPNAPEVTFEVVPGGHLGMLTGRAARGDHVADPRRLPRPAQLARPALGANPRRRYSSAGSRCLAKRGRECRLSVWRRWRLPWSLGTVLLGPAPRARPSPGPHPPRTPTSAGTAASRPADLPTTYVALGDSFTAAPYVPSPTSRTAASAPRATTPDWSRRRSAPPGRRELWRGAHRRPGPTAVLRLHRQHHPAAAEAVTPAAELVTRGHRRQRQRPVQHARARVHPGVRPARGRPARTWSRPARERSSQAVSHIGRQVARSLRLVKERAPDATVVLVGYPRLADKRASCPRMPLTPTATAVSSPGWSRTAGRDGRSGTAYGRGVHRHAHGLPRPRDLLRRALGQRRPHRPGPRPRLPPLRPRAAGGGRARRRAAPMTSTLGRLVETGRMAADWAEALAPVEGAIESMGSSCGRRSPPDAATCRTATGCCAPSSGRCADVRVLVVGQDPYPTPGHPVGLSFSVAADVRPLPRSLIEHLHRAALRPRSADTVVRRPRARGPTRACYCSTGS